MRKLSDILRIKYPCYNFEWSQRATIWSKCLNVCTSGPVLLIGIFAWMSFFIDILDRPFRLWNDFLSTIVFIFLLMSYFLFVSLIAKVVNRKIMKIAEADFYIEKKKREEQKAVLAESKSKEEIQKKIIQIITARAPSEIFASGAVFDISRLQRDRLLFIVHSMDTIALHLWFFQAYTILMTQPEVINVPRSFVNKEIEDINPKDFLKDWETAIYNMPHGERIAYCYISIRNEIYTARMIGIVLHEDKDKDAYYYCMVKKDEEEQSEVKRNLAVHGLGTKKVGEIKGKGFELEDRFLNCIQLDYSIESDEA